MMNRRVVVTGLGLISPLGNDLASSWAAALEGKSGIARITGFDASEFGCQIAGEVKGFDAGKYLDVKEVRRFDKFVHFGVGAGLMALEDSGLEVTEENAPMIGVAIGAGIGGLPSICANNDAMVSRGPRRISPFMIPGCIINMTSGQLAIMKGLKGPNIAHVTACSTGLHAIGEAAYIIARGDADVMLAGGTESTVCKLGIGGFDAMHALSRRNDAPEAASRPFDKDRDGFVMGEGAGLLMLESLEHAQARGATIYAEIIGAGSSDDAFHMTAPRDDGEGMIAAMQRAIADAGVSPDVVDHINAHATSTHLGDICETGAVKQVFGERAYQIAISATKSQTGHLLGAAGGVEAVFSVLALHTGYVPGTINYETPAPECDLNCMTDGAKKLDPQYALSNSFGFGGTNGSILFKKFTA